MMACERVRGGADDRMNMIVGGATAASSRTEPEASVNGGPNNANSPSEAPVQMAAAIPRLKSVGMVNPYFASTHVNKG